MQPTVSKPGMFSRLLQSLTRQRRGVAWSNECWLLAWNQARHPAYQYTLTELNKHSLTITVNQDQQLPDFFRQNFTRSLEQTLETDQLLVFEQIYYTTSWYIINHPVSYNNSAYHPTRLGKLSTSLPGWGQGRACSPVGWQVTLWTHTADDQDGFPMKSYTHL